MTNKFTLILAGTMGLGLALAPVTADAEYRDLCDSSRFCEYTGPNAPVLDADVCLDAAGQVRLKGSSACSQGSVPFHVRHGEVYEPVQQLVVAYVSLESVCSVPGLCAAGEYSGETSTAQALCCENGVCWPSLEGCQGTLMWCDDGVCNEDGTVTCFEGKEFP